MESETPASEDAFHSTGAGCVSFNWRWSVCKHELMRPVSQDRRGILDRVCGPACDTHSSLMRVAASRTRLCPCNAFQALPPQRSLLHRRRVDSLIPRASQAPASLDTRLHPKLEHCMQGLATVAAAAALLLHADGAQAAPSPLIEVTAQTSSSELFRSQPPTRNSIADLADGGFLGFGGTSDGSNPFTVYGVAFKKYVIEVLDGDKIVSRKRGFTVDSCATVLSVAEEDALGPRFQGLPVGEKVRVADTTTCKRSEGPELRPACATSCEATCQAATAAYAAEDKKNTGIDIPEKDLTRVVKSCIRDCRTECSKPGKVFDFVVPSRR